MVELIRAIVIAVLLSGDASRSPATIENVTPIAPIDGGMWDAEIWSPDGSKLAFFSGGELTISDTLGQIRGVAKFDLQARGLVWATPVEVLVYLRNYGVEDSVTHRLVAVDVSTGETKLLEQYKYGSRDKKTESARTFRGPLKSVEGVAYYYQGNKAGERAALWPPDGKAQLGRLHELRTGQDGLYLVSLDRTDSSKISNKPYRPYMTLPMNLSPDRSHIMFGGNIVRLKDDRLIMLDTLSQLRPRPPGTEVCGFGSESFSPVKPEVTFRLTCDDGHNYALSRIGIFNYETFQFSLFDTLLTTSRSLEPAFSPDGARILFFAHGVLYRALIRR